jgi:arsenate reductase-like glutaredoxin family protein
MNATKITILGKPACGASRNTLAMASNSGVEPVIDAKGRRVAP